MVGWNSHALNPDLKIVDLAEAQTGELWAVAQRESALGSASAIFRHSLGKWVSIANVGTRLDAISTHRDGSVVAVGSSSVHIDSAGTVVRKLEMPCARVWGAHASCVYALDGIRRTSLFHFDGDKWAHFDLTANGFPGDWADGDCDSSGVSWIVGTYETHSCMAKGQGTQWQQDGCGSWYLNRVCVKDGGVGFAVGGDGLWQRTGSEWTQVDAYGSLGHMAIAADADARGAVVVTFRFRMAPTVSELDVFVADRWHVVPVPNPGLSLNSHFAAKVGKGPRILLAQGAVVWESNPVA